MFKANRQQCDLSMVSDASGKCKCGAYRGYKLKWPAKMQDGHITVKKLVLIVLAAGIWGKRWSGKNKMAYCDNEAVVAIINKGDSRVAECMLLIGVLHSFKLNFTFLCTHITLVGHLIMHFPEIDYSTLWLTTHRD